MIAYALITPIFSFVGMGYALYQGHSFLNVLLAYIAFSLVGALAVGGVLYQRSVAAERRELEATSIPAE